MGLLSSVAPPATHVLLNLVDRVHDNQSTLFTPGQNLAQKVLAVTASVASIICCICSLYMLSAIDPRRRVFRHQLIAFLISFDFLKATVLLIFPARVMADSRSYASKQFCHIVGFFTATATEGADVAILAFAIHIFLLIFKPGLNAKVRGTNHVEGGLYRYRYVVYGLSLVIPLALASWPFIGIGYESFVCWCYLPQRPYWYRAALSWAPRLVIIIIIFTVYVSIYFHVLREFRHLGGAFDTLNARKGSSVSEETKPSFFSALMFFLRDVRTYCFSKFAVDPSSSRSQSVEARDSDSLESNSHQETSSDEPKGDTPCGPLDVENNLGDAHFHEANLENFRRRQKTIEKQMKSIFIYPIAYISIWLFPLALYATQIRYEKEHGPVVWLNFICAVCQPAMGVVDSLVLFYREQPWKYTVMASFEKENMAKLDFAIASGSSVADTESVTTSARLTMGSLALGMHVDMNQYSAYRLFMAKCRFPFMQLPTDENIAHFQQKYLKQKMEEMRHMATKAKENGSNAHHGEEIDRLQAKHDFSNLLTGYDLTPDIRQKFDGYSLSFSDDLHKSNSSSNLHGTERRPSVASISNKSARSRRISVFEGHDPIPEDAPYATRVASVAKAAEAAEAAEEEGSLDLLDFLGRGPK